MKTVEQDLTGNYESLVATSMVSVVSQDNTRSECLPIYILLSLLLIARYRKQKNIN